MNHEEWKEIDGTPGYFVSNTGKVRHPKGLFKPWKLNTGYLQIKIKRKAYAVHRLVAFAFCPGWFDGAVVNHKNGMRDDNRQENLEWVSHSQNLRHAFTDLGKKGYLKGRFSGEHNTSKPVIATCLSTGKETHYESAMDAARIGFDSGSISHCCYGRYRSHKGFAWRFAHAFGTQRGVEWSPTSIGRGA